MPNIQCASCGKYLSQEELENRECNYCKNKPKERPYSGRWFKDIIDFREWKIINLAINYRKPIIEKSAKHETKQPIMEQPNKIITKQPIIKKESLISQHTIHNAKPVKKKLITNKYIIALIIIIIIIIIRIVYIKTLAW